MEHFPIAESLAADLAGAQVDPNEAQKALAYLRSKRSGKAFFDYLQAIVKNGHVVIRSQQTLTYYQEMLRACQRHLQPLQNDYEQMAQTLGWALRLLRYYRAVPEAAQEKAAQEKIAQRRRSSPSRTTERSYPDEFTGKVVDGDDTVFLIQVPDVDPGEVIAVLAIEEGVPKYRIGKDSARVVVVETRQAKNGRTILTVRRPTKS